MLKHNLLIFFLLIAFAGVAGAATVFKIDLNASPNLDAYQGGAAAYDDGINDWQSYYGVDWRRIARPSGGVPRGANVTNPFLMYGQGNYGLNVEGFADPDYPRGLMTDGWRTVDPELEEIEFVCIPWEADHVMFFSRGVYDIYVYSNEANNRIRFPWHWPPPSFPGSKTMTGMPGYDPDNPTFVEGQNYVVFEGMNIDSAAHGYEWVIILANKSISAIEFVNRGWEITDGVSIVPGPYNYVYAFDRTDQFPPATDDPNGVWGWTQQGEWLDFDIYVEGEPNEGFYDVFASVVGPYPGAHIGFSLDYGTVQDANAYTGAADFGDTPQDTPPIRLYLSGDHRLRVSIESQESFNVHTINFAKSASQVPTCEDIQAMGNALLMDFNGDCIVNFKDFAEFADKWLTCNDPAGCP